MDSYLGTAITLEDRSTADPQSFVEKKSIELMFQTLGKNSPKARSEFHRIKVERAPDSETELDVGISSGGGILRRESSATT